MSDAEDVVAEDLAQGSACGCDEAPLGPTQAQQRVEQRIAKYRSNPTPAARKASAVRTTRGKASKMATRAQTAAARRNIKKAQAARKKLSSPRRRQAKRNSNPVGTIRRTRRSNPVEILEANPVRRRRRRPVATTKRTVYVRKAKPRRGRKQPIINVHVLPKRSAARRRSSPKRRQAARTRRRSAPRIRRAAPRIAGLLTANPAYGDEGVTYEANPARRRPRRKPKKKAKRRSSSRRRRSGVTQSIRVRRSTRAIHLYRNPLTGSMSLGANPVSYGYDDNPLGGYDHNPYGGSGSFGMRSHGVGSFGANPMGMSSYDDSDDDMSFDNNPLLDNPEEGGAFGMANIKRFGVAAGGVALGLVVADFVDRYVATMKPKDGHQPWYGRDAAAAYRQRPSAMRLGVQALGAGGAMFLAYRLKNKSWAPWLFGGLAIGFGANLVKMLADWWLMPAVLKVEEEKANAPSLANRLYPLEQGYVQKKVTDIFKNWNDPIKGLPDLVAAQTEKDPVILGPLSSQTVEMGTSSIYTLGSPNAQPRVHGALGAPLVPTGRVGTCGSCGGQNGCYSGCPTSCPGDCPKGVMPGQLGGAAPAAGEDRLCEYTIDKEGDADYLIAVATAVGLTVNDVAARNPGVRPEQWRQMGTKLVLPEEMCWKILLDSKGAHSEEETASMRKAYAEAERQNAERRLAAFPAVVSGLPESIPAQEPSAPAQVSTLAAAPTQEPLAAPVSVPMSGIAKAAYGFTSGVTSATSSVGASKKKSILAALDSDDE